LRLSRACLVKTDIVLHEKPSSLKKEPTVSAPSPPPASSSAAAVRISSNSRWQVRFRYANPPPADPPAPPPPAALAMAARHIVGIATTSLLPRRRPLPPPPPLAAWFGTAGAGSRVGGGRGAAHTEQASAVGRWPDAVSGVSTAPEVEQQISRPQWQSSQLVCLPPQHPLSYLLRLHTGSSCCCAGDSVASSALGGGGSARRTQSPLGSALQWRQRRLAMHSAQQASGDSASTRHDDTSAWTASDACCGGGGGGGGSCSCGTGAAAGSLAAVASACSSFPGGCCNTDRCSTKPKTRTVPIVAATATARYWQRICAPAGQRRCCPACAALPARAAI
jgi:hypothetical protein